MGTAAHRSAQPAAEVLRDLITGLLGGPPPVRIRCWDGSEMGPPDSDASLLVRSPDALRRLLWAPDELGLGRAYVAGELDIEGDVYALLQLRDRLGDEAAGDEIRLGFGAAGWLRTVRAALRLGIIRGPLPAPAEEARLRGRRHDPQRDAAAIAHHYDVGNDFYRLVLGPSMTYSCAYFERPEASLEQAQQAKYELVCRKLGLQQGMRLLDVGCGWGGMVLHAAQHHGVEAVGITLSAEQCELARRRVEEAGVSDRVRIDRRDYRDLHEGGFDAISSIGMFEHVGLDRLAEYFGDLRGLLRPGGRLLNHGISRPPGRSRFERRSFVERYVFPDGELHEVGGVISAMQQQGFEVRDLESLREHYARTLRTWVANLEADWDRAQRLVGPPRARIWRLYMAGSALGFEAGRTSIHQVLAVRPHSDGRSEMALTRHSFLHGADAALDTNDVDPNDADGDAVMDLTETAAAADSLLSRPST
jgi:cyclopropane-fatty-acyl-phospholipid synthase